MTPEQLLFLAVFALVPLINFLLPWLRKRMEGAGARQPEPAPREAPPRATRPHPLQPARTNVTQEGPRREVLPVRIQPLAVRRFAHGRLGSRRELRRGIVLMAILGPCRGLERRQPPDQPL